MPAASIDPTRSQRLSAACAEWLGRLEYVPTEGFASVIAYCDAIADGMVLRRKLDGALPECAELRARVFTQFIREKDLLLQKLKEVSPTDSEQLQLSEQLDQMTTIAGEYLASVLGDAQITALERAFRIETLRGDLLFLNAVLATVDGNALPEPALATKIRLDRIGELLRPTASTPNAPLHAHLRQEWEDYRRRLIHRRVHDEVSQGTEGVSAGDLWLRRIQLSRLQAEVQTLEIDGDCPASESANQVTEWLDQLARYRNHLSDRANQSLAELSLPRLQAAWESLRNLAHETTNEIWTFLEEIRLSTAVCLLERTHEDLLRLQSSAEQSLARTTTAADSDAVLETTGATLRKSLTTLGQLRRRVRAELQEKRLSRRMEGLFGRRGTGWIENAVLLLILAMTGLIASEWILENRGLMTPFNYQLFAWADLLLCSLFLSEFFLKFSLVNDRWLYVRRKFIVDLFASIPFGFIAYQIHVSAASMTRLESASLLRLLRFLRLPRLARYIVMARPFIRAGRLLVFSLRTADQLVRRYAWLLNRNIVLFEPAEPEAPQSRLQRQLATLRTQSQRAQRELEPELSETDRIELARRNLRDFSIRMDQLPAAALILSADASAVGREIPAEAVVEQLIEMTPERFVEELGQPLADSVHRYLQLLDVPGLRRLPILRDLLAQRQRNAAEVAAMAANYLGNWLQSVLQSVYFWADLQGTISAPVFLDRLGNTIVTATARPTKRLLIFGFIFLLIYAMASLSPYGWLFWIMERLQRILGLPVIVLGLLCAAPLLLGLWMRRIANQATEFCERVVEAQFASQTKSLKTIKREQDSRFLIDRVIAPEIRLRHCDDPGGGSAEAFLAETRTLEDYRHLPHDNDEMVFLHNVELLYQEYLDGSLFHKNDTKTTTQLLGNLALSNLRQSNLAHSLRDAKRLRALDLSRTGGSLFGGPYVWFNYMTRMITQETAKLLIDYNRNAVPWNRLQCAPRAVRERYRRWLAQRLQIEPQNVSLPNSIGTFGDAADAGTTPRNSQWEELFETVDFNAIDFLIPSEERHREVEQKYGPQVAELLARDCRLNIRRAFRSFPLHQVPLSQRTINPYALYEARLAGGRILVFPFWMLAWTARLFLHGLRKVVQLIHDILHPTVAQAVIGDVDRFAIAVRKIHRMRKPVFMQSLWLRGRFDIEYAGVSLPGVPASVAKRSLLEQDLDFIGASRHDRLEAERLLQNQRAAMVRIHRWLTRLGYTIEQLPPLLQQDFPHLANRAAEVVRAIVTAFVVDHDDIATLAWSIDGTKRLMDWAASDRPLDELPPGLPPLVNLKDPHWYRTQTRRRFRVDDIYLIPGFTGYSEKQRLRIGQFLRHHRRIAAGWITVLLGIGDHDPVDIVRRRVLEVIFRTDLWSDQILALRTVQTLSMIDVYHYCEMVWKLGRYEELEGTDFDEAAAGLRLFSGRRQAG